jgi:hypothetical protein
MVIDVADIILVPGQIRQHLPISIFPLPNHTVQTANLTFLSGVAMTVE